MNIRPGGGASCSIRADRQKDTMKLTVAFRSFAEVSRNGFTFDLIGPDMKYTLGFLNWKPAL